VPHLDSPAAGSSPTHRCRSRKRRRSLEFVTWASAGVSSWGNRERSSNNLGRKPDRGLECHDPIQVGLTPEVDGRIRPVRTTPLRARAHDAGRDALGSRNATVRGSRLIGPHRRRFGFLTTDIRLGVNRERGSASRRPAACVTSGVSPWGKRERSFNNLGRKPDRGLECHDPIQVGLTPEVDGRIRPVRTTPLRARSLRLAKQIATTIPRIRDLGRQPVGQTGAKHNNLGRKSDLDHSDREEFGMDRRGNRAASMTLFSRKAHQSLTIARARTDGCG
jgi:hypothetical protein